MERDLNLIDFIYPFECMRIDIGMQLSNMMPQMAPWSTLRTFETVAADGSFEPKMTDAALLTKVRFAAARGCQSMDRA